MSKYRVHKTIMNVCGIFSAILLLGNSEFIITRSLFAEIRNDSSNSEEVYSVDNSPDEKKFPTKIVKKIFLSSIKIIGPVEGSGVIINKTGDTYTILTAWHVLKDAGETEEVQILTSDAKKHNAITTSKQRIGASDMATIKFISPLNYQLASKSESNFIRGTKIFVAGYSRNVQDYIEIEAGRIVQSTVDYINSGYPNLFMDQGYQLIYTNETLKGMSGGGIFSIEGHLIGVHGRGELERRITIRENKLVKSGVNYGMPLNLYTNPALALASRLDKVNIVDSSALTLSKAIEMSQSMIYGEEQLMLTFVDEILSLRITFPALYLKSSIMSILGDHVNTLSIINKALELPHLSREERKLALVVRSGAYAVMNKLNLALKDYYAHLKLADNIDEIVSDLLLISSALSQLERLDEAQKIDVRISTYESDNTLSVFTRFRILSHLGFKAFFSKDFDLAALHFESALSLDIPEELVNRKLSLKQFLASEIYPEINRSNESILILSEIISSDPFNITAKIDRAIVSFKMLDYNSAQRDVDSVFELRPADNQALFVQSLIYLMRDKDLVKACYYFDRSTMEKGGNKGYHNEGLLDLECEKLRTNK